MKTPAQLVEERLWSATDHKKRSTAIRRVAGGIRTEITGVRNSGLSDSEMKALQRAEAILNDLASLHSRAGKLRKAQDDALQKAIAAVRSALDKNFGRLASVADRVAFVSSTGSWVFREGRVQTLSDLAYYFDDQLSSLAYQLGKDAVAEKLTPEAVVTAAWQTFEGGKADLLVKHRETIFRLQQLN